MKFYLKILNEVRQGRILKVDGNSGARFLFTWDVKLRAYVHHPENQDEVDDLFRTMGKTTSYIFAPVEIEKTHIPMGISPAIVTPLPVPMQPKLSDTLTEQCLSRGVVVTEDDSSDVAERLIKAYDKGALDTVDRLPNKKSTKSKSV